VPGARKGGRGKQTRVRIVDAATTLFSEVGYVDTTMAAIAAEAGVAVQTLYLSCGSKVAILEAAHDMAVVGDNEGLTVLERTWVADARAEPDGLRALKVVITNICRINGRVAPIYRVIQAASADPDVAALFDQIRKQRLITMRALAEDLVTKQGFARSRSAGWAADVLYAIGSVEFLGLVVLERQWTAKDLEAWVYEIAAARLFPSRPPRG